MLFNTHIRSSRALRIGLSLTILMSLLQLTSCKGVESQGASNLFASGQLPKSLYRLANQVYEIRSKEDEIVQRVQKDAQNPNILEVAVIDNGVDLSHPDLMDQVAFDIEKGRLVGAGYDFMGEDRWASSNLISAQLFAFGAQKIDDGLIVGEVESPLKLLSDMNQQFWTYLDQEFQADPLLKTSLYSKLNRSNFTIVGAYDTVVLARFYDEDYKKKQEKGELISVSNREKLQKEGALRRGDLILSVIDSPWNLKADKGYPIEIEYHLSDLEHYDRFWPALKRAYDKVTTPQSFGRAFSTYLEYVSARDTEFDRSAKYDVQKRLEIISNALSFVVTQREVVDPLFELKNKVRDLGYEGFVFEPFDPNHFFSRDLTFNSVMDAMFRRVSSVLSFKLNLAQNDPAEIRSLREGASRQGVLRELSQWVMQERSTESPKTREQWASAYRRYIMRAKHPYLSEASADSTHGSHVSGKIAEANPEVRIRPVRVTTQTMDIAPSALKKIRTDFMVDFKNWLAEPLVYKALSKLIGESRSDFEFTIEAKEKTLSRLMDLLKEKIEISFQQNSLDYKFLNEVKSALSYVGKQNVLLANISLGINFEDAPTSVREGDKQFSLELIYEFLRFEYFKYRIAEVVQADAPNTLFVIAAGNDGKWIDGQSRSALPVDLSSPWLEGLQNDLGVIAPNNRLKNILAVGSIGPNHQLSSFTNIPINVNTPFVLAEGESVLSAIKSWDLEAIDQTLTRKVPELKNLSAVFLNKDEIQEWMKQNLTNYATLDELDRDSLELYFRKSLSSSGDVIRDWLDVIKLHLFINYPDHRARLSGTSMATPTVVSLLARLVVEKAKRLNIPLRKVTGHPSFLPETLLEDVFQKVQPLKPGSRGISLSKWVGDQKQTPTVESMALEERLNNLIERGTLNNTLFNLVSESPSQPSSTPQTGLIRTLSPCQKKLSGH